MNKKHQPEYSKIYERKRRQDGLNIRASFKKIRRFLRSLVKAGELPKVVYACLFVGLYKAMYGMSYRDLAAHFLIHPEDARYHGIHKDPSKSTLHAMVKRVAEMESNFFDDLLLQLVPAGKCAEDLCGDATGFSLNQYGVWSHAKYGTQSKKEFVKLHIIATITGTILSFVVTSSSCHDSTTFCEMFEKLPDGASNIVALDAGYDSNEIYDAIAAANRVPVIKPRKNGIARGNSPRSKCIRWYKERPDDFMEAYGKRNNVESLFSSMKKRMGTGVCSKLFSTQTFELFCRILCHNMTV